MRLNEDLLEIYRNDEFFQKLKEVWNKHKNKQDKSLHITDKGEKGLILLNLNTRFTKYPNILIEQLLEVNFSSKECFKVFLRLYRLIIWKNTMTFKCKKGYLTKNMKINRVTLDRTLKELQDKNMVLVDKENGEFSFTLNLCFLNWNVSDNEKVAIMENIKDEIKYYDEEYIQHRNLI